MPSSGCCAIRRCARGWDVMPARPPRAGSRGRVSPRASNRSTIPWSRPGRHDGGREPPGRSECSGEPLDPADGSARRAPPASADPDQQDRGVPRCRRSVRPHLRSALRRGGGDARHHPLPAAEPASAGGHAALQFRRRLLRQLHAPHPGEDRRGHAFPRGPPQHQHRAGREPRVDDADGPGPVGPAVARLRGDGRRDRVLRRQPAVLGARVVVDDVLHRDPAVWHAHARPAASRAALVVDLCGRGGVAGLRLLARGHGKPLPAPRRLGRRIDLLPRAVFLPEPVRPLPGRRRASALCLHARALPVERHAPGRRGCRARGWPAREHDAIPVAERRRRLGRAAHAGAVGPPRRQGLLPARRRGRRLGGRGRPRRSAVGRVERRLAGQRRQLSRRSDGEGFRHPRDPPVGVEQRARRVAAEPDSGDGVWLCRFGDRSRQAGRLAHPGSLLHAQQLPEHPGEGRDRGAGRAAPRDLEGGRRRQGSRPPRRGRRVRSDSRERAGGGVDSDQRPLADHAGAHGRGWRRVFRHARRHDRGGGDAAARPRPSELMPVAAPSATGAGRAAFAAASVASAVLLQSFCFHDPHWVPLLLAEGLMVLAAFRPFDGLLVFAALAPLAGVIITAIDAQAAGGTRFVEVLALAFITGASARRAFERRPFAIPPRLAWTAAPLVVLALASGIVQAAVLSAEQPALWRGDPFPIGLIRDDLILGNSLSAALQFAEGLLLVLLALECCGADPRNRTRAARMMIVAATAAASLNVLRVTTAAMRQDHFWRAVGSIATQFRVNIHFSDWNAAGSYFAMVLLVAAAFAIWRGARYAIPIVLLAAALWLTGSRTAFGAVTLVALALGAIDVGRRGERRASVLAALAVLVLLAGAGWTWYPEQRNDAASFSLSSRLALARAGVRMAADHPVFGVGVQQYYQLSDDYAGDLLASFGRVKENAHNYFVQVLAELGVPGFALFVAVLVLALRAAWPGPAAPPSDWGLPAGLVAYLLTCLGGHPLLTPEAAYPFWIALGIAAAAGTARAPAPRWLRWTVSVAILLVAASLPIRAVFAVRHARLDNTAIGLSAWQRSGDDVRFRWTAGRGTFYVSAAAAAVSIRLRLGPDAPGPMLARVSVNGRQANQVQITSADDWKKVRFVRAQGVRADFVRVDVEAVGAPPPASPAARVLAIGQPEMLWSSDAPANDVPMSADLDGDGKADLVLWSAGTARWRWLTSSTGL